MKLLQQINTSIFYWLVMAVGAIGLEGVALYYQYAIGEEPCVVCIQVRIWVMALYYYRLSLGRQSEKKPIALRSMNVLGVITSVGLFERSYYLLGVERLWDPRWQLRNDSGSSLGGFDLEKMVPSYLRSKNAMWLYALYFSLRFLWRRFYLQYQFLRFWLRWL